MPITTKGTFLAYKGIREDGKDVHSGTIDNSPGQTPTMPRRLVNDDPNQGCSQGLHVGAFEYASHWGPRVVLVEVDPADVVSVPADHSYQKCRACKYKVLRDSEGLLQDGVASVLEPYKLAPGAKASLAQDLADLLCVVHVTE
jgi:hypothetical protein